MRYDQGGFSVLLPEDSASYDTLISELESNNFYDMNTRLILLEATLYNPGENLFGVLRIGVSGAEKPRGMWECTVQLTILCGLAV